MWLYQTYLKSQILKTFPVVNHLEECHSGMNRYGYIFYEISLRNSFQFLSEANKKNFIKIHFELHHFWNLFIHCSSALRNSVQHKGNKATPVDFSCSKANLNELFMARGLKSNVIFYTSQKIGKLELDENPQRTKIYRLHSHFTEKGTKISRRENVW